jgi:hypothetical protein
MGSTLTSRTGGVGREFATARPGSAQVGLAGLAFAILALYRRMSAPSSVALSARS